MYYPPGWCISVQFNVIKQYTNVMDFLERHDTENKNCVTK